jgi:hypothetical protein
MHRVCDMWAGNWGAPAAARGAAHRNIAVEQIYLKQPPALQHLEGTLARREPGSVLQSTRWP